jgi:hypothetical protein
VRYVTDSLVRTAIMAKREKAATAKVAPNAAPPASGKPAPAAAPTAGAGNELDAILKQVRARVCVRDLRV